MPKKPREIKVILLELLGNLENLCDETDLKAKIKKDPFLLGYISGQIVTIGRFRKLIEENL